MCQSGSSVVIKGTPKEGINNNKRELLGKEAIGELCTFCFSVTLKTALKSNL